MYREIGYDARLSVSAVEQFCKTNFSSISHYIPVPVSVDPMVWPSIFKDLETGAGLSVGQRRNLRLEGRPTPDWIGPDRPLWENFQQLLDHVEAETQPYTLIAVSKRLSQPQNQRVKKASAEEMLYQFDALWGYDVADSALCSAIFNFGNDVFYSLFEKGCLNRNGLFKNCKSAEAFAIDASDLFDEHAPFRVYSIWSSGINEKTES